jgi:hypothetical protein
MKNKKTLVLGASAKPEKYAFKAITCLLRKDILFLRLVKMREKWRNKIQTKAIPLKTSIQLLYI